MEDGHGGVTGIVVAVEAEVLRGRGGNGFGLRLGAGPQRADAAGAAAEDGNQEQSGEVDSDDRATTHAEGPHKEKSSRRSGCFTGT